MSTKRKEIFIFKEKTVSIEGKFHAVSNEEVVAYDPKEGRWEMVGERMGWCMFSDAYCVIGNVLYSAYDGVFRWYDTEERMWSFLHVWLDYLGSLVIEGFDWVIRVER